MMATKNQEPVVETDSDRNTTRLKAYRIRKMRYVAQSKLVDDIQSRSFILGRMHDDGFPFDLESLRSIRAMLIDAGVK